MSNNSVIKSGMNKARKLIQRHMIISGRELAINALTGAVRAWDAKWTNKNLTGNTRTGFCSAAFWNGRLCGRVFNVFDLPAQPMHPTSPITQVGASGFKDYDSGEYIGSDKDPAVRQYKNPDYSFIDGAEGEYAYNLTESWIKNVYMPPKKGLAVVVANCTPYANFLREIRSMDILESESNGDEVARKIESAFANTPLEQV